MAAWESGQTAGDGASWQRPMVGSAGMAVAAAGGRGARRRRWSRTLARRRHEGERLSEGKNLRSETDLFFLLGYKGARQIGR